MRMARPSTFIIVVIMLLAGLTNCAGSAYEDHAFMNYVRDACSVTIYRDLCIRSLASFSNIAKRSPSKWARAAVSVTLSQVKTVNQYLIKLKKLGCMRGRSGVALADCIECFQTSIDELHKSLGILRSLNARNFYTQMSDLTTFMSAALTDEGTCLDGFEGQHGRQINLLKNKVLNSTYFTSNALALVNKLATTGLEGLTDP